MNPLSFESIVQQLPDDFTFGVATSAYQIEGATCTDGRGPSIWDAFCREPGRVYQQHDGSVACEHYALWQKDLDLIASLGVDAYRFSLAWPRMMPTGRAPVNLKGLDFYDRLIDGMLARGLRPFATLYHWDLPLALQERGGWTKRGTAEALADYAGVVVRHLGDRLDTLATFNEPWCSCHHSYLNGVHAPGQKDLNATLEAIHHTNLAHGLAVQAARAERTSLPMGVVLNALSLVPASDGDEDLAALERAFQFNNGVFFGPLFNGAYDEQFLQALGDQLPVRDGDMAAIRQPLDFWGFNYYFPNGVAHDPDPEANFPQARMVDATDSDVRTDIGWEVDPQGLARLLHKVYQRYDLPPCYITENGACYNTGLDRHGIINDAERIQYMAQHIGTVAELVAAGTDIRGYFAWSLMDNFEWAEGYSMRFGIVHVNFSNQQRTVKQSGHWYQSLVTAHGH